MAKKNASASKIFFSGLLGGVLGLVFSPVIFLVVAFHSIRLLGNPDFDNKALLKNTLVLLVFSPFYCFGVGVMRGVSVAWFGKGFLGDFNLLGLFSRADVNTNNGRSFDENPLFAAVLLDHLERCIKAKKKSNTSEVSDILKKHNGYSTAQIPIAFGVVAAGVVFALVMTGAFSPLLPIMVGVATGYVALATAGVVLGAAVLVSAGMWGAHKITSGPAQTDFQNPVNVAIEQTSAKATELGVDKDVVVHDEPEEPYPSNAITYIKQVLASGNPPKDMQGWLFSSDRGFFKTQGESGQVQAFSEEGAPPEIIKVATQIERFVSEENNGWSFGQVAGDKNNVRLTHRDVDQTSYYEKTLPQKGFIYDAVTPQDPPTHSGNQPRAT